MNAKSILFKFWLEIKILPFEGVINPVIKSIIVVLPDPDLPVIPMNSFWFIEKFIFFIIQLFDWGYLYQTDLKTMLA